MYRRAASRRPTSTHILPPISDAERKARIKASPLKICVGGRLDKVAVRYWLPPRRDAVRIVSFRVCTRDRCRYGTRAPLRGEESPSSSSFFSFLFFFSFFFVVVVVVSIFLLVAVSMVSLCPPPSLPFFFWHGFYFTVIIYLTVNVAFFWFFFSNRNVRFSFDRKW